MQAESISRVWSQEKSHILVKMTNCTDLLIFIFKHVLNLLHFLRTLLLLKGAI